MPSGRTHDRITLWGLPFAVGGTLALTQSGNLTLIVSGAYLFSGLMFGPDLDLHSVQYKRWGPLRWIWIPYQKMLRHRSLFSHGPIIGTTLRIVYLASWLGMLGFGLWIAHLVWGGSWNWHRLTESAKAWTRYSPEWLALYLGLELGAMSHSVSDWGGSTYKRFKKLGMSGMLPHAKMKKRKSTSRRTKQAPIKRRHQK